MGVWGCSLHSWLLGKSGSAPWDLPGRNWSFAKRVLLCEPVQLEMEKREIIATDGAEAWRGNPALAMGMKVGNPRGLTLQQGAVRAEEFSGI